MERTFFRFLGEAQLREHSIREADSKKEWRFYSPEQIRLLLGTLTEPCASVVSIAVLTGMRIGEILALRWKRIDLLGAILTVAENYSSGDFGSPKTKSSRRVIPISTALRRVLEQPAQGCGESLVVPCATVVLALDTKTGQVCRAAALHGENYPLCLRLYQAYPDNKAEASGSNTKSSPTWRIVQITGGEIQLRAELP